MAKKAPHKRKKGEKQERIDNIPKYFQQPRSPAPKRRTDFSPFIRCPSSSSCSFSNSLSHPGSLLESSCGKEILSSVTIATLDDRKSRTRNLSMNPLALQRKKQLLGTPDGPSNSSQQVQSPDKWNSSDSSRTQSDFLETGRGKRTPKPKVHFDEVTFPLRSVRKVRRVRIMRYLGLAAPIGSPFSFAHVRIASK